uniref:Uncharacterized protein n=1 Tax=Strigamia maritima TaxID=126957 RepID=T1JI48_STRMM
MDTPISLVVKRASWCAICPWEENSETIWESISGPELSVRFIVPVRRTRSDVINDAITLQMTISAMTGEVTNNN